MAETQRTALATPPVVEVELLDQERPAFTPANSDTASDARLAAARAYRRWAIIRATDSDWWIPDEWNDAEIAEGNALRKAAEPSRKPSKEAMARVEALFSAGGTTRRPAPTEKDKGALALVAGKLFRRLDAKLAREAAAAWGTVNTGMTAAEIAAVLDWTAARAGAGARG